MNIVKDVPSEKTTKNDTKMFVIVLALLAILILMTLMVFYVMHVRRRNFKKQGNSTNFFFLKMLIDLTLHGCKNVWNLGMAGLAGHAIKNKNHKHSMN